MAGKQKAALEERARDLLGAAGHQNLTVEAPWITRPAAARLEIVHPQLAALRRSQRHDRLVHLAEEEAGQAAALLLELAQMTKVLREGGMRATADYRLGCIVVGWGRQPPADYDQIRREVAARHDGHPVPGDVDDLALVQWAGTPAAEIDGLTGALQAAAQAIAPGYRPPARPPARRTPDSRPGRSL